MSRQVYGAFDKMGCGLEWLRSLRDVGPSAQPHRNMPSAHTFRRMGWTDFLVRDRRDGQLKPLGAVKSTLTEGEAVLPLIDYEDGLEVITEKGRKALARWESGVKHYVVGS